MLAGTVSNMIEPLIDLPVATMLVGLTAVTSLADLAIMFALYS